MGCRPHPQRHGVLNHDTGYGEDGIARAFGKALAAPCLWSAGGLSQTRRELAPVQFLSQEPDCGNQGAMIALVRMGEATEEQGTKGEQVSKSETRSLSLVQPRLSD
jgi:hypothetical protein